ncbi:uncharacterized membrane protein HdeD (DUF308 family) [Microbacteriaceae bacterium SG_E_30_P1]|uniref:Uncharacterized membrane protein HdeD (DUF308 family) n=1 Tax=Antiquaquibacter oligotrophicus TaxID=2880260 RepID=A0ABT6KP66_9MICO|nr:DUF308 domain-containing protein [Antiquaquibacter oligotrophicus]MDH6180882.1 uncharacterized membrane protein HdeD (DUF308 family) [Antiquaquibacter oligotrophicus]UDF13410.1 DUF308 domain-containing protein [Antiquaquibacter oligotrophicus]
MTDPAASSAPLDNQIEDAAEELEEPLVQLSAGPWWWVLIRGILAIAFGVLALIWPASAFLAIAIVFGAYALVDGITEIIHAVRIRNTAPRWGWLLFAGIVSVLAGLAALILPGLAGLVGGLFLLWTIVFYNIAHGVMVIGSASGAVGKGKTWAVIAGVASILFGIALGILIWVVPGAAIFGLVFAIGIYAIAFGIMLAVAAIQARSHGKETVEPQFA